ncbi:MAG: phosphatidate cytidylyltransferase [Sphingomonas bacterium]|uniref:phosphatidate cytidylyltransferase n=1 Tax=Sphingomonas bacterium TaxID=1895847 RepID=UPI002629BD2C|nr:phosphatidate cytidylyltransferase [Sphingomonas bacterium]MDB5697024.1 phosphatidate cytidylyltransferase [Sphingomonas bacterium]
MTGDSQPRPRSDLAVRSAVGLGLIAVAVAAVGLGGLYFWLVVTIAALLMLGEWADLHAAPAKARRLAQFALFVPLVTMTPEWVIGETRDFFTVGLLVGAAFFVVIVSRMPKLALGVIYVGVPVLALIVIRRQLGVDGLVWTFWALALVWATDIGAYFAGRTIGGPKLLPSVSPNKTWAGLIGGVIAAGALAAILHVAAGLPLRLALATPFLAVLAQGGDLYESWLKRRAGVKDSGDLLPGHGGVLDRLDGLVPVAPVAALLVVLPTVRAFLAQQFG